MRTYPYSIFMATPVAPANASMSRRVTENALRVESLDHLKIDSKLKVIIAQGFDPDEPSRWSSRSDALFYVCCEMVRAGLADEVILGVITDSRFTISESVLDKGSQMIRYATRQIERARDKAEHPMLAEMNSQFAVILNYGKKVAILVEDGEIDPDTGRLVSIIQAEKDFRTRIKNYPRIEFETTTPGGKPKIEKISAAEWWMSHKRRRQYRGYCFEPGVEMPEHVNSWAGFSVAPTPGDKHHRFIDHIREIICGGDERCFEYLIRWMARCVQRPRTPSMVAPVLLGIRGIGKSLFCDFFGQIFDPHRHTVSDINALTGKFNAHLAQCILVIAEEAFDLRDKRHESVLKEFITGRKISIEPKGFDRIQLKNYAHLIMTSNNERVVPAGDYERRFLVLRVSPKRLKDRAYFGQLLEDQRSGGVSNLLHYLMTLDISEFDVTDVPQTDALREQQEHNLALETEWLLHKLETGQWFEGRSSNWRVVIKAELYEDYRLYLERSKERRIRGPRSFHGMITRELPDVTDKQVYVRPNSTDRMTAFVFPELEQCRALFDKNRGWTDHTWPDLSVSADPADVIPLTGRSNRPDGPF